MQATSAGMKEQEAVNFLEKKMKENPSFTFDETVQVNYLHYLSYFPCLCSNTVTYVHLAADYLCCYFVDTNLLIFLMKYQMHIVPHVDIFIRL